MLDQFSEALKKLYEKLQGWINEIVLALPNIVLAVLVLVAVFLNSRSTQARPVSV